MWAALNIAAQIEGREPFLPKPALLRREFTAEAGITSATLYVSALGLTEMYLNREISQERKWLEERILTGDLMHKVKVKK